MPKGNPNPTPATRFKKGQSGNPSGRSKEEQAANVEAAKIAANLRLKALSCLQDKVGGDQMSAMDLELILNPATLKLIKDSEDRAHGTPSQDINHRSDDGSMAPKPTVIELVAEPVPDDQSTD